MRSYLRGSNSPVLITGDQSLAEAISYGKLFFYQTQPWKIDFYNKYREYCRYKLPRNKIYHRFLAESSALNLLEFFRGLIFRGNIRNIVRLMKKSDLVVVAQKMSNYIKKEQNIEYCIIALIKKMVINDISLNEQLVNLTQHIVTKKYSLKQFKKEYNSLIQSKHGKRKRDSSISFLVKRSKKKRRKLQNDY